MRLNEGINGDNKDSKVVGGSGGNTGSNSSSSSGSEQSSFASRNGLRLDGFGLSSSRADIGGVEGSGDSGKGGANVATPVLLSRMSLAPGGVGGVGNASAGSKGGATVVAANNSSANADYDRDNDEEDEDDDEIYRQWDFDGIISRQSSRRARLRVVEVDEEKDDDDRDEREGGKQDLEEEEEEEGKRIVLRDSSESSQLWLDVEVDGQIKTVLRIDASRGMSKEAVAEVEANPLDSVRLSSSLSSSASLSFSDSFVAGDATALATAATATATATAVAAAAAVAIPPQCLAVEHGFGANGIDGGGMKSQRAMRRRRYGPSADNFPIDPPVYLNRYTVVLDVMLPELGIRGRQSLTAVMQTHALRNDACASWFVRGDGAVGCIKYGRAGMVRRGRWHRLALAVDCAAGLVEYYVDGVLAVSLRDGERIKVPGDR